VAILRSAELAVLVGVQLPGESSQEHAATLEELEALLDTAGGAPVAVVSQRRAAPDPATYIGKGKLEEIKEIIAATGADAVVFNEDLSPAQQRNLEERLNVKILDRTIIILDIFAQHATSREGKAQVEVAQLTYMLPRLRGWGDALSRQAGGRAAGGAGMGGRGPGETQLEVDRRKIDRRMTKLRRDLKGYERIRRTKSSQREDSRVPTIAVVGYTNAGKSSLLNRLTKSDVLVEDRLFATLDPTARQMELPDGRTVVMTDTVGFIRKLPTGLIQSFLSTLEESARADMLLHVVDASHPEAEAHIVAVQEVLEEIGADTLPFILALNKSDNIDRTTLEALARRVKVELDTEPILVSAHSGEGCDELVTTLGLRMPSNRIPITATVPFSEHALVALAHEHGEVESEEHGEHGTTLVAAVDVAVARRMRRYLEVDPFPDETEEWER
jgi:GTP-binding protein HflX